MTNNELKFKKIESDCLPVVKRYVLNKNGELDLHLSSDKMCVLTISFEEISCDYITDICPCGVVKLCYGKDQ